MIKKKIAEIGCSLHKYYGRVQKNTPVARAINRSFGIKTSLDGQQIQTIKSDIQILKREITKQKGILKQWI